MDIRVLQAGAEHAETIAITGRRSFQDTFASFFTSAGELQQYLDNTYHPAKISGSILKPNNVFFLALCNEKPAGFAKIKKQSLNKQVPASRQTELQKIYVLPEYWGNGTGALLMESVLNFVQIIQPEYLWLDVHITNERAGRFYKKYGFIKHGEHQFVIGTQIFEYDVMLLPVSPAAAKNK